MSFFADLVWGRGPPERIGCDWEHEGTTLSARSCPVYGAVGKDYGSQWADWWGTPGSHKLTVLINHSLCETEGVEVNFLEFTRMDLKGVGWEGRVPRIHGIQKMSLCVPFALWFYTAVFCFVFLLCVFFFKFGLGIPLQWSEHLSTLFCRLVIVLNAFFGNVLPFPIQV